MKALEKMEAEERKIRRFIKALSRCQVCGKQLQYSEAHLAHRIPKGYAEKLGSEIIHHELNMVITCAGCNSSVLLTPAAHPVECRELIEKIMKTLEA